MRNASKVSSNGDASEKRRNTKGSVEENRDVPGSSSSPSGAESLFRVASSQNAENLASFSGMPFGQLGLGTALTPGAVWHAHAANLARAGSAFPEDGNLHAIELVEGTIVRFEDVSTAVPGARSSDPPSQTRSKVTNNRAIVAFPGLAQSPAFVQSLRRDFKHLLQEFSTRWVQLMREDISQTTAKGKEKATPPSIVRCFEDVWLEDGWQFVPLAAGEEKETRKEMWDTITSSMLLALDALSVTILQNKTPSAPELLHGVGVMLALFVLWATSPPSVDITEVTMQAPPSIYPEDHETIVPTERSKDWNRIIGQGWKIGIEADLLTVLARIPDLAKGLLDSSFASAAPPEPERITPSMELREVLHTMMASGPDCASPEALPNSSTAFHVLPPTSSGIRFPLAPALNKSAIAGTSLADAKLYAARGLLLPAGSAGSSETRKRKRAEADGDCAAED